MEAMKLLGSEAVTVARNFKFPDGSERYATKRTKFEKDKPVVELAEIPDTGDISFVIEGELFQGIVLVVKLIDNEVKMLFNPEGLEIRIVDSAHVAMEDIFVPREAFVEYNLLYRHMVVSLNVKELKDLKIKWNTDLVNIVMAPKYKAITERVQIDKIAHDFISLEYGDESIRIAFNNMERKISTIDNAAVRRPKLPEIKKFLCNPFHCFCTSH